jgi:protease-4
MSAESNQKRPLNPLALVLILSGVFFFLFLVVSSFFYFSRFAGNAEPKASAGLFKREAVAVVELNGVILDSKKILRRLERVAEDSEIKAVVLRLNSPGGAVAPSQEIYEAVKKFKKPLVASMSSVAASGAFYIACGAKKVFANPGTITGSIGVIMEFANLEKLYEWAKIQRYSIKTGKFKDAGADYKAMSPEDRALLQGMVDDVLVQFKSAVATGRKLKMEEVDQIADGRVLSGNQALKAHLVDQLGTIDDAIADVSKQAGISGKPRIVYPEEPKRKIWELLLDQSAQDSESDAESRAGVLEHLFGNVLRGLVGGSGVLPSLPERAETVTSPGLYWIWNGAR